MQWILTEVRLAIRRVLAWPQDVGGTPNIRGGPNLFTIQSHSQELTISEKTVKTIHIYQGGYSHQAREVKNYFRPLVLLSSGVMTDHRVLRQSQLLPAHPNVSSHSQHSTSLSSKMTHAMFTSIHSPVPARH